MTDTRTPTGTWIALALAAALFPSAAQARSGLSSQLPSRLTSWATADFDGDRRQDMAVSEPQGFFDDVYRYRVTVQLTGSSNSSFLVNSREAGTGLHIIARDVDGDADLDLVISTEFGRHPIGVWINNGHGDFTQDKEGIYPEFVWTSTDRFLESPFRPLHGNFVLADSGQRFADEQFLWPIHVLSGTVLVHPPQPLTFGSVLNPGTPLRAPPLS